MNADGQNKIESSPLVIPVFIPHSGCPHQCAFCNQSVITCQDDRSAKSKGVLPACDLIDQTIQEYLEYKKDRKKVELAFFGGNFLGLDPDDILRLLECVQPWVNKGKIDTIRFSTRPDTISNDSLDLIEPYPVSVIELGIQSMNEGVLLKSRRGHTTEDTIQAIRLLKERNYTAGVQVMVGLPGDTDMTLMESTQLVAELKPDLARIYPLMVLKGSLLEEWYHQGKYEPLSLEKSIELVKEMVHIFKENQVKVIRMGLQASDIMEDDSMLIAGPWHPAFGHLVFSRILYDRACEIIDNRMPDIPDPILLKVHPSCESRLRGDKNSNIVRLKERYPNVDIIIETDDSVSVDDVKIG